jgi:hypothetical protein
MGESFYGQRVSDGDRLVAQGQGLIWETLNRQGGGSGSAMASGTQYYMLVPLFAGVTISGIGLDMTGAGASVTLLKCGLVTPLTGGLLASSASLHASVGITFLDVPFSTAYTPTVDGVAYAVALAVAGTGPSLIRSQNAFTNNVRTGYTSVSGTRTGLADISSLVPSSNNGSPNFYMALI